MDQASPLRPIISKVLFTKKKNVSAKDNLKCCILAGEGGKPGNEAKRLLLLIKLQVQVLGIFINYCFQKIKLATAQGVLIQSLRNRAGQGKLHYNKLN